VNPFAVLGLPEWPDLEDETVRAAWVAIVAETSPDRADGGDPGRFAEACMAYFELNNAWGRSVAYAELVREDWTEGCCPEHDSCPWAGSGCETLPVTAWPIVFVVPTAGLRGVLCRVAEIPYRVRDGHPVRLLIRAAIIAGLCLVVLAVFPGGPADFAVLVLALFFVASAYRDDLTPSEFDAFRDLGRS
jgi:hypothetical protein